MPRSAPSAHLERRLLPRSAPGALLGRRLMRRSAPGVLLLIGRPPVLTNGKSGKIDLHLDQFRTAGPRDYLKMTADLESIRRLSGVDDWVRGWTPVGREKGRLSHTRGKVSDGFLVQPPRNRRLAPMLRRIVLIFTVILSPRSTRTVAWLFHRLAIFVEYAKRPCHLPFPMRFPHSFCTTATLPPLHRVFTWAVSLFRFFRCAYTHLFCATNPGLDALAPATSRPSCRCAVYSHRQRAISCSFNTHIQPLAMYGKPVTWVLDTFAAPPALSPAALSHGLLRCAVYLHSQRAYSSYFDIYIPTTANPRLAYWTLSLHHWLSLRQHSVTPSCAAPCIHIASRAVFHCLFP